VILDVRKLPDLLVWGLVLAVAAIAFTAGAVFQEWLAGGG
jgi:hypothetical protein